MASGVGLTELIILTVMLMVFFGGKKLPEFIKGTADGIKEFKKATKEQE